jgi:transposase
LRRAPRHLGLPRARWTLRLLAGAVGWLAALSESGAHRLVRRLGLRYRRGQEHLHSPDPDYDAKLAAVRRAAREARRPGGRAALVYLDEVTYYRRPSVARCHAPAGGPGRYAEQGYRRNAKRRVIGALDACAGRLTYAQAGKAGVAELARFFRRLRAGYPAAVVVYVALDNWPVHFHPRVLAALPAGVVLLRLPTYAPWTNPVEKVWRKLKQEVLHQHDFADDWAGLQAEVEAWLAGARADPAGLRRYTGLRRRRRRRMPN